MTNLLHAWSAGYARGLTPGAQTELEILAALHGELGGGPAERRRAARAGGRAVGVDLVEVAHASSGARASSSAIAGAAQIAGLAYARRRLLIDDRHVGE